MPHKDKIEGSRYRKARYYQRRAEAIALLGGKCVKCGSTNDLELDHIDPTIRSFDIGPMIDGCIDTIMPELLKCQVLCHLCHTQKTVLERGNQLARHGLRNMYERYGCRCDLCRAASAAYRREYRARKKSLTPPNGVL
jgi:5-methylcytosine-specific restriction endonuclease McrA